MAGCVEGQQLLGLVVIVETDGPKNYLAFGGTRDGGMSPDRAGIVLAEMAARVIAERIGLAIAMAAPVGGHA